MDVSMKAFQERVTDHVPFLLGLGVMFTRDRPSAEDLVQDTVVSALLNYHSYREEDNMRAWLSRILRNRFLNDRKKESSRRHLSLSHATFAPGMWMAQRTTAPDATAEGRDVRRALDSITEAQRAVLKLVDVEGLKYQEAASVMGCKLGTVMSRIHRARSAIAAAMS